MTEKFSPRKLVLSGKGTRTWFSRVSLGLALKWTISALSQVTLAFYEMKKLDLIIWRYFQNLTFFKNSFYKNNVYYLKIQKTQKNLTNLYSCKPTTHRESQLTLWHIAIQTILLILFFDSKCTYIYFGCQGINGVITNGVTLCALFHIYVYAYICTKLYIYKSYTYIYMLYICIVHISFLGPFHLLKINISWRSCITVHTLFHSILSTLKYFMFIIPY